MEERAWSITKIDIGMGAVAAVAVAVFTALSGAPWLTGVGVGALAVAAPSLARIDIAIKRLPNPITLPLLALGTSIALVHLATGNPVGPAVAAGCALLLTIMAFAGGMGMGDLKLGAAIVFAVSASPAAPLVAVFAAFMLGGAAGLVLLLRGQRRLPFGPFLLAGAFVSFAFEIAL